MAHIVSIAGKSGKGKVVLRLSLRRSHIYSTENQTYEVNKMLIELSTNIITYYYPVIV